MQNLELPFLRDIVAAAPDGIVVCDPRDGDWHVRYVNPAFEQLTGYSAKELLGGNLRMLQGTDREQEALRRLREALSRGEEGRVLLRNYRKNGELFWNEMHLRPLRDAKGVLQHFASFHRDVGNLLRGADRSIEGLPTWLREDRVSGVSSKAWFEELLGREWQAARREGRLLTLMIFDIDALGSYNDTFGRGAGDACIRRIARGIAGSFRRGTDVVGRWSEAGIAVLAVHRNAAEVGPVIRHADMTLQRIAEMRMHHPRSPLQKYMTVTGGLASAQPGREEEGAGRLVEQAQQALAEAKRSRRGALVVFGAGQEVAGEANGQETGVTIAITPIEALSK
jgi:diguanylate cyclase (GGDEF)-like protein/PAS domain S-box-containing protein